MNKLKVAFSFFWVIIGVFLLVFAHMQDVQQILYIGLAFAIIGLLQLLRIVRYYTSASYKEQVDLTENDERVQFISNKAWSCAGYCYVLLMAVTMMVLMVMGREEYMVLSAGLAVMVVLYWICYLILNRKY